MLCCKCGKETDTDSEVCRFCGEPLPDAGISDRNQLERAAAAGTRRMRIKFILIGVVAIALRVLAAVSGGPSADEICVQNGEAYLKQGMYDKALAEFDKAVTINPVKTEAYIERFGIYELKKDYDKAIGEVDHLITLTGEFRWYIQRGEILRKKGAYEQALIDYDKGLEDPKTSYRWKRAAYLGRGRIYEKQQHYENAVESYSNAIEMGVERGVVYFRRGQCYYALEKFEEALADFTKAAKLNPGIYEYHVCRANALTKLGRFDEANEVMEKAEADKK